VFVRAGLLGERQVLQYNNATGSSRHDRYRTIVVACRPDGALKVLAERNLEVHSMLTPLLEAGAIDSFHHSLAAREGFLDFVSWHGDDYTGAFLLEHHKDT